MLEEQTLLLRPWTGAGAARGARRDVVHPSTGRLLGFARKQSSGLPAWRSWLDVPVVAVHEAEDEPLLCTVQRFWWFGPTWEVREADGHRVAALTREHLTDRWGRPLAVRRRGQGGAVVWARPAAGSTLALLTPGDGDLLLRFADDIAGQPFAKMALLAAALVREAA
jgi:hypothetical protein